MLPSCQRASCFSPPLTLPCVADIAPDCGYRTSAVRLHLVSLAERCVDEVPDVVDAVLRLLRLLQPQGEVVHGPAVVGKEAEEVHQDCGNQGAEGRSSGLRQPGRRGRFFGTTVRLTLLEEDLLWRAVAVASSYEHPTRAPSAPHIIASITEPNPSHLTHGTSHSHATPRLTGGEPHVLREHGRHSMPGRTLRPCAQRRRQATAVGCVRVVHVERIGEDLHLQAAREAGE